MNLIQLRLFRDIATEFSFVKAAQKNHISQPAVSVHIRKLEEELGRRLFTRTPHNIQLTSDGIAIMQDVKEILRLCDNLKSKSTVDPGILEGSIRVASVHSIGMYEIGEVLSSFMKDFPRIHLHLEYQTFETIYELLLKEKIDVGIVAYPENRVRIETIPYGHDEMVVIAARDHPLGRYKTVAIDQLNGQPFIGFDEGIPTREALDTVFREQNIRIDLRMTNDNIYTLKKAVEAGVGLSIVPAKSVDEEVHQGTLKRLKIRGVNLTRPLALVKLRKTRLSRPLKVFIQRMLATAS